MKLESLVSNITGKVRREKYDGKNYWVAPLSMIIPGVLNGSRGPLLYPLDELARNPHAWNGMPIVLNHPKDSAGNDVSARSPAILEKYGMGNVYGATVNGKLAAEGWFEEVKTRLLAPTVAAKLERNEAIELSTGLETDNHKVKNKADFNGKEYTHVARNYRPDHLAVLLGAKGACSIADGCGVNVNQEGGSTVNKCDCDKCVGDRVKKTKKKVTAETYNRRKESRMAKLTAEQKEEVINSLITNEGIDDVESPWSEDDRELLDSFTEDRLLSMNSVRELAANAAKDDEEDEEEEDEEEEETPPPKKGKTKNASVLQKKKKKVKMTGTCNDEDEEEVVLTERQTNRRKSTKEWLADAPDDIRSAVTNALNFEREQKQTLMSRILKNERNAFGKEYLRTRSLEELQGLAALATNVEDEPRHGSQVLIPHFGGVGGVGYTQNLGEDFAHEDLDMVPTPFEWETADAD